LPASDYEFAEWRLARVRLDHHVEIEGFYCSQSRDQPANAGHLLAVKIARVNQ